MRDLYEKWIRTPSLRGQLIWLNVSSGNAADQSADFGAAGHQCHGVLCESGGPVCHARSKPKPFHKDANVGGYAASDMQEYCNGGSGFRKQK